MLDPPQGPPVLAVTKQSIADEVQRVIEKECAFLDNLVLTLTPETATFEATIEALERNSARYHGLFLRYVSPDADVRKAVTQANEALDAHQTKCLFRDDVFQLVDALYQKRSSLGLDAEDLRLLEKKHQEYILQGIGLPPGGEEREKLATIEARISALIGEFVRNTMEENGSLWCSLEEINGLPSDVIGALEKGTGDSEGKLRLSFKTPHVTAVLNHATDGETRKRMYLGNQNKCNQNSAILKSIALLRDEKARLLGFNSHAFLELSQKMAQTPATVDSFLENIRVGCTLAAQAELEKLKKMKGADLAARGLTYDGRFYLWDKAYYTRILNEKEFNVDSEEISQYFGLDITVTRMLNIYESLMGFKFVRLDAADLDRLSPTGKAQDVTWHKDNIVYSVWEEMEAEGDQEKEDSAKSCFLGYLYMDLHPRVGKFTNAAQMAIETGWTLRDGTRHYPATALICNFSPPTADKPSLLKHSELIALFHELGHGIHNLASKTRYSKFHGTATALDFIEAPSQMLENWCWTPSVLQSLSSHWKTGQQIPIDLVQQLIATKNVNSAISNLHLLHMSLFDMAIHNPRSRAELETLDIAETYTSLLSTICQLDGVDAEACKT